MLLNITEMHSVELLIFRNCQEEAFIEEISCLKLKTKQISRKSLLFKCSPYLDEMGVLRMKGRIDVAESVSMETKRPVILPRKHIVSKLLVDFYHRRYHHHHNEIVVNEVRQKYWIPGLRALLRSVAHRLSGLQKQTCDALFSRDGRPTFRKSSCIYSSIYVHWRWLFWTIRCDSWASTRKKVGCTLHLFNS